MQTFKIGKSTTTFKIGEYALGGIIRTSIDDNANITIEALDFDTKELVQKRIFSFVDKFKVQMYLEDITSAYYADHIMSHLYV